MEEVWQREGFRRMRECLAPSAVYCLLWQGTVVYVGKSTNVFWRLGAHHVKLNRQLKGRAAYSNAGKPILFDDVWVKYVAEEDLDFAERKLIQRYRPIHNTQYNRPIRELPNLPAFAELLARARGKPIRRRPLSTLGSKRSALGQNFGQTYERRRVNP